MSEEILKANPRHQRMVILVLTLVAAVAVWGVLDLEHELSMASGVSLQSVHQAAEQIMQVATRYFHLLAAALGLFGLYLVILAYRIVSSGRYPSPGAFIVRDMPIVRGQRAKWRAVATGTIGLALVAMSFWIPSWAESQLKNVLSGAMQTPDTPPADLMPYVE